MAKFDAEDLLASILSIMKDNDVLNTRIAAIETEKGALSPAMKSIAATSYHVQTWSDKILQSNPAIFYGIEDVTSFDGGGGVVAKTYKVFIEVVLVDNGQTNDIWRRIFRYARALEEIFSTAYAPAIAGGSIKIEAVRPVSVKLELDSSDEIKIGGILLTITLV